MDIIVEIPEDIAKYLEKEETDGPQVGRVELAEAFSLSEREARYYIKAWHNRIYTSNRPPGVKKLVVIADMHCGHRAGLTPPNWQYSGDLEEGNDRYKYMLTQREMWEAYTALIRKHKPIDILVVNGDAIDGKGERSGGTEQITASMLEQVEIAKECIDICEAKNIVVVYGTPYHASPSGEDFELTLAKQINASAIGSHEWVDISGVVFDFKHKIASSTVPYSRATAVMKEQLWNLLWSERELQPKADVIVRSHVHYGIAVKDATGKLAMTTPALQGFSTKYGARQCSGLVDHGITWFDITDDGKITWDYDTIDIYSHKAKMLYL